MDASIEKLLPLSEATYYILLALREPAHGYAIMQQVEAISEGAVKIGPGTLYGAFANLEKQGLIEMVREAERRKIYTMTDLGRHVLLAQLRRLRVMAHLSMQCSSLYSTVISLGCNGSSGAPFTGLPDRTSGYPSPLSPRSNENALSCLAASRADVEGRP